LHRGDALLVSRHEEDCPEPDTQRQLRLMQRSACGNRGLMTTIVTLKLSSCRQARGLSASASRTAEAVRPLPLKEELLAL
jgi:hypothetical protein